MSVISLLHRRFRSLPIAWSVQDLFSDQVGVDSLTQRSVARAAHLGLVFPPPSSPRFSTLPSSSRHGPRVGACRAVIISLITRICSPSIITLYQYLQSLAAQYRCPDSIPSSNIYPTTKSQSTPTPTCTLRRSLAFWAVLRSRTPKPKCKAQLLHQSS